MFEIGLTVPAVFGDSTVKGIERAAAAGAEGVEFFDWESADAEVLSEAAEEYDIEIYGTLAAGAGRTIMDAGTASLADPGSHETAVTDLERSIEAAADLGCTTLITTVGQDNEAIDDATQRSAIVSALRTVAPLAESCNVTLVVEPLNVRVDHPAYFLTTTDAGVAVVDAIDSPNVKLLYDVYHQQITEGDVIRRLKRQIAHIGHIHIADNPGRREPGTGELDYGQIFTAIAETDYDGYVSGEFYPDDDPDAAAREFVALADEARR